MTSINKSLGRNATTDQSGAFVRQQSSFRNWITPDGSPGPQGGGGFKAETGRYHLYLTLNCPWAHRALIYRTLKNLEDIISISLLDPRRTAQGWAFTNFPGCTPDPIFDAQLISELYYIADKNYSSRFTVPLLWDKKQNTIVNNESADIIRMLNTAFQHIASPSQNYYPIALQQTIDDINEFTYSKINNGVYRAGFAQSQQAYEEAYQQLFDGLDHIEQLLEGNCYLCGELITEADWRLFPTLIRFDCVYYGLFKCNKKRLSDYPNLSRYTAKLYNHPGIKDTINFTHIKQGYWRKSERNPLGIVPLGPELCFEI